MQAQGPKKNLGTSRNKKEAQRGRIGKVPDPRLLLRMLGISYSNFLLTLKLQGQLSHFSHSTEIYNPPPPTFHTCYWQQIRGKVKGRLEVSLP